MNKRFPGELLSAVIAFEKHKDLSNHLHLLLVFRPKKITSNPHYFDFITGKHGHYTTVRDLARCLTYIKKDLNFFSWGQPIETQNKNKSLGSDTLRLRLKTPDYRPEALFEDLTEELDKAIYNDASKIDIYSRRFQSFLHYKKLNSKKTLKSFDLNRILTAPAHLQPYALACLPILNTLNRWANERRYKAKNLFLWSHSPNMGKSSLFNLLIDITPTYEYPSDN